MENADMHATVENSNMYFLIQPNGNPDLTITKISEPKEIMKLNIAPSALNVQQITSLTFAYSSDFSASSRLNITKTLKEALPSKINYNNNEFSIMGFKDRNMHFNAIIGHEFVIWCNQIISPDCSGKIICMLRDIIADSDIAPSFGLPKRPSFVTKLFMIPDTLGFFRNDIFQALTDSGFSPFNLNLLIGKEHKGDCKTNVMGTHGNVKLKYPDNIQPPTSVRIKLPCSDAPDAELRLKIYNQHDYSTAPTFDEASPRNQNPFHKTASCHFYANDGRCRKGDHCPFAHGEVELQFHRERFKKEKQARKADQTVSDEPLFEEDPFFHVSNPQDPIVVDVNSAATFPAADSSFEDQEEDAGSVNADNSLLPKPFGNSATTQDSVPDLSTSEPNTTMTAQSLTVSSSTMATLPISANFLNNNNTSTKNDTQPRTGSFKQKVTLVDSSRVGNSELASTVTAVASVTPTPKSTGNSKPASAVAAGASVIPTPKLTGNSKLASTATGVASVTPTPKSTAKRSFSEVATPSPTNSGGKPNSTSPPSAVNTPMRQVSKDARTMSPADRLLTPE